MTGITNSVVKAHISIVSGYPNTVAGVRTTGPKIGVEISTVKEITLIMLIHGTVSINIAGADQIHGHAQGLINLSIRHLQLYLVVAQVILLPI